MKRLAQKHVRFDKLGRRSRYTRAPKLDPKTGKPERVNPVPSDLPALEAIYRCGGMLTSSILHEYRRLKATNRNGLPVSHKTATNFRLNKLSTSTNTPHGGSYLQCPDAQWKEAFDFERDGNELMYDTTPQALEVLGEHGLLRKHPPARSKSKTHDGLKACAVASLELACLREPEKYVFGHHDMVCDELGIDPQFDCRVDFVDPVTGVHFSDESRVEPDHLGYIRNIEKDTILYFIIEQDNHNEVGIPSTNAKFKARRNHLKTILQYKYLFRKSLLRQYFKQEGGVVLLYLCTNEGLRANILEISKRVSYNQQGLGFLFAKTVPGKSYDRFFKPPPITDLLHEPLANARGEFLTLG